MNDSTSKPSNHTICVSVGSDMEKSARLQIQAGQLAEHRYRVEGYVSGWIPIDDDNRENLDCLSQTPDYHGCVESEISPCGKFYRFIYGYRARWLEIQDTPESISALPINSWLAANEEQGCIPLAKSKNPKQGYVYAAINRATRLIKVGCSGDPAKRVKAVTGRPELMATFPSDDMYCLEQNMHLYLGWYQKTPPGSKEVEWFDCSMDDVYAAYEYMAVQS